MQLNYKICYLPILTKTHCTVVGGFKYFLIITKQLLLWLYIIFFHSFTPNMLWQEIKLPEFEKFLRKYFVVEMIWLLASLSC